MYHESFIVLLTIVLDIFEKKYSIASFDLYCIPSIGLCLFSTNGALHVINFPLCGGDPDQHKLNVSQPFIEVPNWKLYKNAYLIHRLMRPECMTTSFKQLKIIKHVPHIREEHVSSEIQFPIYTVICRRLIYLGLCLMLSKSMVVLLMTWTSNKMK